MFRIEQTSIRRNLPTSSEHEPEKSLRPTNRWAAEYLDAKLADPSGATVQTLARTWIGRPASSDLEHIQ